MVSKRRIRRRQCTNKQRFDTSAEAGYSAYLLTKSGKSRGAVHVYKCKFCGKYHIGHPTWKTNVVLRKKGLIV